MTRFVMPSSQAVHLLLKATEMAKGGEIFILKMPSVRILDLAHTIIEELCRIPASKIDEHKVRIIGKKPGEKLHEELMTRNEAENSLETRDMFITLPEIIEEPNAYTRRYPNAKPAKVKSYTSDNAKFLTKRETIELLYEWQILGKSD